MNDKVFFITTPIFYPNDKPHLGHAYTMVMADIIFRYKFSKGYKVFFQTGIDEHGEKIVVSAKKKKISSNDLIESNLCFFKELFKKLEINDYLFFRTSSIEHTKSVQSIFQTLFNNGDIYFSKYTGFYCVSCEEYAEDVTNRLCSFCFSKLDEIKEDAYFLSVTKYYSWLKDIYQNNTDFILPKNIKKNLLVSFLDKDQRDLCVTRNNPVFGIAVPNNPNMSIYVWFDALLNYYTSSFGKSFFVKKDVEILHIIGKDISRFHCIYWPIILKMLSLRIPNVILAHGWILNKGSKMSKSKGNVIDPILLLEKYPVYLLRLYFISKISFLQDGLFNEVLLSEFYSSFFVNNLGNLALRVKKMVFLYSEAHVPFNSLEFEHSMLLEYRELCEKLVLKFQLLMDEYKLTSAFGCLEELIFRSNKLINDFAVWNRLEEKNEVDSFLLIIVNGIKIICFLLGFFVKSISNEILLFFSNSFLNVGVSTNWTNCLDSEIIKGVYFFGDIKPIFKKM